MINNNQIFELVKDEFQQDKKLGKIVLLRKQEVINIDSKDIIGNSIQTWFGHWLRKNDISYETPENTQEFPDFIINPHTQNTQYLEVKSWYGPASPAFDIANFESYIATTLVNPNKIDADYLIFKYNVLKDHTIIIEDVFLKKVWEITGPSTGTPLKVQRKKGVIYNIRPVTWESKRAKFKPFNNRLEFAEAVSNTYINYTETDEEKSLAAKAWLSSIQTTYKLNNNEDL